MGQEEIIFLKNEETEETFANDDSDIEEDTENQYEEYFWLIDDEPNGYTYKSKKAVFAKAVNTLKSTLKKGVQKQMNKLQIKVLDFRRNMNKPEIDIEITKGSDRGNAVLKFYGPNSKKEHTLMVCKLKKHDLKFVTILALEIVKPLLDSFISGEGWMNLLVKSSAKSHEKPHQCKVCSKGFVSEKNFENSQ